MRERERAGHLIGGTTGLEAVQASLTVGVGNAINHLLPAITNHAHNVVDALPSQTRHSAQLHHMQTSYITNHTHNAVDALPSQTRQSAQLHTYKPHVAHDCILHGHMHESIACCV